MIVGFAGQLGSGKDTAALRLMEAARDAHLIAERICFADKLKDSASAALGVNRNVLELNKNNPAGLITVSDELGVIAVLTIRQYLQFYGTEAHRDIFGDDFWTDAAIPLKSGRFWAEDRAMRCVTDVRFPNEAQRIKDVGGYVVKVTGPHDRFFRVEHNEAGDPEGWVDSETGEWAHPSETALRGWDFDAQIHNTVRNDGYANLDRELGALCQKLRLFTYKERVPA